MTLQVEFWTVVGFLITFMSLEVVQQYRITGGNHG